MTTSARPSAVGPTRLVFRMADVLAANGAAYPMAGALSAAVRGRHQLDRSEYARELGITLEQVDEPGEWDANGHVIWQRCYTVSLSYG